MSKQTFFHLPESIGIPSNPIASRRTYFWAFVSLFIALNLSFKFFQLEIPESGGDAAYNWLNCKYVATGNLDWDSWNHHRTRWGVILPNVVSILLLGKGLTVFYVTTLFYSSLSVLLLCLIMREARFGLLAGLVVLSSYLFFPPLIRASSQLLPGIYSSTYLLGAVYFLVRYSKKMDYLNLGCAGICAVLLYECKFTGALFFPGLCLSVLLLRGKKRHFVLFSGSLFAALFIELLLYRFFLGYEHGRLDIIRSTHLSSLTSEVIVHSFADVFNRYTGLVGWWRWMMMLFLLSCLSFLLSAKHRNRFFAVFLVSALSFYIGLLLVIVDLNPLTFGILYLPRYLIVGLPMVFLCIGSMFNYPPEKGENTAELLLFSIKNVPRLIAGILCKLSMFGSTVERGLQRFHLLILLLVLTCSLHFATVSLRAIILDRHTVCEVHQLVTRFNAEFKAGTPILGPRKTGLIIRGLLWNDWEGAQGPNQSVGEMRVVINGRKEVLYFENHSDFNKQLSWEKGIVVWNGPFMRLQEFPTRISFEQMD